MKMVQQIKNAFLIIKQIKQGEWEFKGMYEYSFSPHFKCYTAHREGLDLWVANGAWACGIRDQRWQLGALGGRLVWYLAARIEVKKLERRMKRKPANLAGREIR